MNGKISYGPFEPPSGDLLDYIERVVKDDIHPLPWKQGSNDQAHLVLNSKDMPVIECHSASHAEQYVEWINAHFSTYDEELV